MSIIKQISVYDGSSWGINDIGANAGNIDLIAPDSSTATNLAGSSNLFTALNNILPTSQLTASRALVTDANKKLAASTTTATQLSYVHGVTSNIQTQIDTLNTNLSNKYTTGAKATSSATSVAANSYTTIPIDVSKSGYTPLGVLLLEKTGGSSLYCVPSSWTLSGNTLSVQIRNTAAIDASVSIGVTILYQKS